MEADQREEDIQCPLFEGSMRERQPAEPGGAADVLHEHHHPQPSRAVVAGEGDPGDGGEECQGKVGDIGCRDRPHHLPELGVAEVEIGGEDQFAGPPHGPAEDKQQPHDQRH